MKHPTHKKIEELISSGVKSREYIAEKLNMTTRTLIRRLHDGTWSLPEIVGIEEIFGAKLLVYGDKYDTEAEEGQVTDVPHTYSPRSGYKIKVELDPEFFDPINFDARNKQLTDELIRRFQRKNTDDSEE